MPEVLSRRERSLADAYCRAGTYLPLGHIDLRYRRAIAGWGRVAASGAVRSTEADRTWQRPARGFAA